MSKLKVLDLFSGIGGFSLGLEQTGGFETVAFAEINKFCREKLAKNFPGVPIYEDVRSVDYEGRVDVITSGDPCQRDSRANAGRDGESLWPLTLDHVKKYKPVYVIRENVAGNIDTGTLLRVENDLRAEGYKVRTYGLLAVCFGAAHHRSRTWTLAHSDSPGQQECNYATESSAPKGRKHSMSVGAHGIYWVGSEPPVLRRIDDVPNRVDRIRALGNSVIPAIPEMIGHAILDSLNIEGKTA